MGLGGSAGLHLRDVDQVLSVTDMNDKTCSLCVLDTWVSVSPLNPPNTFNLCSFRFMPVSEELNGGLIGHALSDVDEVLSVADTNVKSCEAPASVRPLQPVWPTEADYITTCCRSNPLGFELE